MTDLVARPLPIRNLAELNDVTITSIADGEIIVWDSGTSRYINNTLAEAGISATSHTHTASEVTDFSTAADARIAAAVINALSDVTITAAASGDFLRHNGTAWVDATISASDLPAMVGDSGSGGTKGAVPAPAAGDAAANKYLKADGTWATVAGGGASAIDDLTDVTITAAASGDFLRHNGTAWVDATIAASDLPTMVGDSGSGGTKGAVPAPAAGDAAANKYLKADGTWATVAGGGASAIDDLTDVTITAAASGDFLRHNGTAWVDATIAASDLPTMVGDSGSGGTKGAVPAPAAGDAAANKYLKADGTWATVAGGGASAIDDLTDVTITAAASGDFLRHNGTAWVDATIAASDLPSAVQGWYANHLINTSFRTWGHAITSPVTLTDGAYVGPTGWFFLTSGATCTVGSGTGLGNSASSIILTNNSGSTRRVGASQFVEYYDCLNLRSKEVTFAVKVKRSTTGNVRAALVNWTGTANSPTKDIVNDWTSTTYTEGNFFISSASLDIIAVSSAVSVGTSATAVSVTGTVGASTNNLQVIVWSQDTIEDTGTMEISEAVLCLGATATIYEIQPYDIEIFRCDYRCRLHQSDSSQTDAILGWGHGASTTVAVCQVPFGHPMRVVPSLTYTASDWQVADSVGARQDVTALAISTTVSSRRILFMTSTVASGLTVGRGMATVADTTSGRWLKFDAEIGV